MFGKNAKFYTSILEKIVGLQEDSIQHLGNLNNLLTISTHHVDLLIDQNKRLTAMLEDLQKPNGENLPGAYQCADKVHLIENNTNMVMAGYIGEQTVRCITADYSHDCTNFTYSVCNVNEIAPGWVDETCDSPEEE